MALILQITGPGSLRWPGPHSRPG